MRKIALFVMSAVMVGSLVGCGKKEDKATIKVDGEKKVEIKTDEKKIDVDVKK